MQKSIKTKIKTILATTAVAALSLATVAVASAWGPSRDTYTMEEPADHPVFNSITNNPVFGDERDFVRVGEINADVTDLKNEIEVQPGKQYLVYIYFHNNASSTYNDSAHNNSGVALATRMSTTFTNFITPGEKGTIAATITADNADPKSVWDEAYFTTKTDKVVMRYVVGSAKIYNDWKANGSTMPSSLFTEEGALIGLNALNGVIPGCEEYSGAVTYVLEAQQLAGTVEKTVSVDGEKYDTSVTASESDELYFKLTIKNAGDVALSNATIQDSLPEGLTLVEGSVELSANDSTVKDQLSDNLIKTGYNLGTIGTGNTVYITYRAKVGQDFDCGELKLTNTAKLTYDSELETGDSDTSSASVLVEKDGCDLPTEIANTGPLEITMAIVIVLGISGGGFYLYRTRRTLRAVKNEVTGPAESSTPADEGQKDNEN